MRATEIQLRMPAPQASLSVRGPIAMTERSMEWSDRIPLRGPKSTLRRRSA
jgi:hypothetical protein